MPIPCTNGQLEPSHWGSSISSFAPAASTLGSVGSIATYGSFCLFWGNDVAGLAPVTFASVAACAPAASTPVATTPRTPANAIRLLTISSFRLQVPN